MRLFSSQTARRIAWQGSTVTERIEAARASRRLDIAHEAETRHADVDLSDWRDRYDGQTSRFDDRLRVSGTTTAEWRVAVGRSTWPADVAVPGWVLRTDALCSRLRDELDPPDSEGTGAVPFDHVLTPAVEHGREQLSADSLSVLTDDAVNDAAAWLRRRLGTVAVRTLQTEFRVFVRQRSADSPAGAYREFVDSLGDPASLRFLVGEYPVLWRYLVTRIRQWVETVETLDSRIEAAETELASRLGVETPGRVTGLEFLSDDSHRGGDVVVGVTFDGGTTVVYKPRPVASERLLRQIVTDVSDAAGLETRDVATVDRNTHGFVEWVDPAPCDDENEVRAFFRRAGVTVAATYCTCTNDCHRENLLADGAFPTLVDGETLCHPETGSVRDDDDFRRHTVLSTGLLPFNSGDQSGRRAVENAGLVDPDPSPPTSPFDDRYWSNVNTGRMAFDAEDVVCGDDRPSNLPRLDGEAQSGRSFVPELRSGFRAAYDAVRSEPGLILDRSFEGVERRVIGGFSWMYRDVLSTLLYPKNLEDGERITWTLEGLLARIDDGVTDERFELFRAERQALVNTDVPRFSARLGDDDGLVPTCVDGLDRVRERLDRLSDVDRRRQTDQLALALDPEYTPGDARQCSQAGNETTATGAGVGSGDTVGVSASGDVDERGELGASADGDVDERGKLGASAGGDVGGGSESGTAADRDASTAGSAAPGVSTGRGKTGREPPTGPPTQNTGGVATPSAPVGDVSVAVEAAIRGICSELLDDRPEWVGDDEWRRLQRTGDGDRLTVSELGAGLYDGVGGVALFLALAGDSLDLPEARERAISLGDRVREHALGVADGDGRIERIGVVSGVGSLLYTLSRLGELTGESRFLDAGVRLSESVTRRGTTRETPADLLTGTAGLLCGAVKLATQRDRDSVRRLMDDCVDRLVESRRATTSGRTTWRSSDDGTAPVGLSHGASGVAHALARYDEVVGDERAQSVVADVRDDERRTFDPAIRNCSVGADDDHTEAGDGHIGAGDYADAQEIGHRGDESRVSSDGVADAWCHGRTGTLLSRLVDGERSTVADWESDALRAVAESDPSTGSDSLCCGTAGQIDALVRIGDALDDDRCHDAAARLAGDLCCRRAERGCLSLPVHTTTIRNPTLFQGVAGVGYALLRATVAGPENTVLLFE